MRAVVVYESMFGNTRTVAEAIAEELRDAMDVEVLRADQATDLRMHSVDLFVVGAPTHAWGSTSSEHPEGLSRERPRVRW